MKFCFPKQFLVYEKKGEYFHVWWKVWIRFPFIFKGNENDFSDINEVWKIEAPTMIKFERNACWHSFQISFLGFGVGYARQWDY